MRSTPNFEPEINKQMFNHTYGTDDAYKRLHHNLSPLKVERIGSSIQRRQLSATLRPKVKF